MCGSGVSSRHVTIGEVYSRTQRRKDGQNFNAGKGTSRGLAIWIVLLLRQCMVPSTNYFVRCIAPVCIEDEAHRFDQRVMEAAMDKLGLDGAERGERTAKLLQRKLRDGGWGLTPAVRTSPAAFLGSLATCHAEPVFAGYCGGTPLPYTSLLRG